MRQAIPQVSVQQTEAFSKQWNYNGVAILLNEIHIKFATDWANIVLANFVRECQIKAEQAMKAAQAPKIITEE